MTINANMKKIFQAGGFLLALYFFPHTASAQTVFEPVLDQGKVEFPEGGMVDFPADGQVSFNPEGQVENTVVFSTEVSASQDYFAPYRDATLPAVEQTLQGTEVEIESTVDLNQGTNAETTTER